MTLSTIHTISTTLCVSYSGAYSRICRRQSYWNGAVRRAGVATVHST